MDLEPPADLAELNRRVAGWLERYFHSVPHGTTKVAPHERFAIERQGFGALPPVRFDTARKETRKVGRTPLVEWDTVFYSAPPELAGRTVEVRQPTSERVLELRFLGQDGGHPPPGGTGSARPVAPRAQGRHRGDRPRPQAAGARSSDEPASVPAGVGDVIELGDGDYDVAVPDLALMGAIAPDPDLTPPVDIASDRRTEGGCGCTGGGR